MDRRPVSVVVATRDRPELLAGCLASIKAALDDGDELIVVDSASRSPEVREVAEAHGTRYIRCDVPGASRARNLGWRAATSDIIAFVDDDARVTPGWADAVARAFAEGGAVDFVTGRIDHPDPVDRAERPVAIFRHAEPFPIGPATAEPFGHGANHAVRRDALEAVGGFDEGLGPGTTFRASEDLDLWDRLVGTGHDGRYVPDIVGSHEQWRDRRDNVGLDWSYGIGSGARLAKLLRTDRARAARSSRLLFWEWGIELTRLQIHQRRRYLALLNVVRMAGAIVGFARAILVPVRDGHLVPRRRRGRLRGDRPSGRR